MLFCLAKKVGKSKEEFEKEVKEWITRQEWEKKSSETQALGILRSYLNHWNDYNWSWRGFLRKHLLESPDFEDKEKLKQILSDFMISLGFSSSHAQSNSIIPPDLSKATKWMWRDIDREIVERVENNNGKFIFYVKGVNQTIHRVIYEHGEWKCDCRGYKKNRICSHILKAYSHIIQNKS